MHKPLREQTMEAMAMMMLGAKSSRDAGINKINELWQKRNK